MISHDQAQLLASERLDGPLSAADAEALATHLLTCADCRAFARQMEAISVGIRAMPHLPPSPTVSRGVQEAIAGQRPRWGWLSNGIALASSPALAVASAILLIFAVSGVVYLAASPGQSRLIAQDVPPTTAVPDGWRPAEEATSVATVLPAPSQAALIVPTPTTAAAKTTVAPRATAVPTATPAAKAAEPTNRPVVAPTSAAESAAPPPADATQPGAGTGDVAGSEPITTRTRSRGNDPAVTPESRVTAVSEAQPAETPVVAIEEPTLPAVAATGPDSSGETPSVGGDAAPAEATIAGRVTEPVAVTPVSEALPTTEAPELPIATIVADVVVEEPTIAPVVDDAPALSSSPTPTDVPMVAATAPELPDVAGGLDLPPGDLGLLAVVGSGQAWSDPTVSDYGLQLYTAPDAIGNASVAITDATGMPLLLDPTEEVHSDVVLTWLGDSAIFQRAYPDGRLELRSASSGGGGGYALWSGFDGGTFNTGIDQARVAGDWLAYISGGQVFIAPLSDPNSAIPLSTTPVVGYDLSPDGSRVAVSNGYGISVYAVGSSEPFITVGNAGGIAIGTIDWTWDGILVSRPNTGDIVLLPVP